MPDTTPKRDFAREAAEEIVPTVGATCDCTISYDARHLCPVCTRARIRRFIASAIDADRMEREEHDEYEAQQMIRQHEVIARLRTALAEAQAENGRDGESIINMDRAILNLEAENAALRARVEAVRALHTVSKLGCTVCGLKAGWPCPTIRALDASEEESDVGS